MFNFDTCFGPEAGTPKIYHDVVRPITKDALDGFNGSIFMYGQTTSGKTYTMLGSEDSPGILPCAVRDIFNGIRKEKDTFEYTIHVSYLEIYNENIHDLFCRDRSQQNDLKFINDPHHGVAVQGLMRQQVKTFEQAMILMHFGEEQRVYKETNIHDHSSRSHTIFRIQIQKKPLNKSGGLKIIYSTLNLVDLAGSERLNEFDTKSDIQGETQYINKSLFTLSLVINKLAESKSSHIPYRDSKLTRILQHALGGNSKTAIICTISPASINFYQTLSTLRFASRASAIKNVPM